MPTLEIPHLGTPIGENLLVLPDPPETQTKEGIEIPEAAIQKKRTGTIVAMGPEVQDNFPKDKFKIGGRLRWLFELPSGVEILGTEYLILHPTDIALILGDDFNG